MSRLLLMLLFALGTAHADEVEVIQLEYRTAEQLIPMLRPLVEPGGAVSGMQSTLVIRASRANIAQFRQVLETLDRTPRRLLISVRQDAGGGFEQRGAGVSGTVASGDARVSVNEAPRRESGVTIGAFDSSGSRDASTATQVQALEGSPAFIAVGQSVPVQSTVVTSTPGGTVVQRTTGLPEHRQRRLRHPASLRRSRVPRHRASCVEPGPAGRRRGERPTDLDHRERTPRRMVSARRDRPVGDAPHGRGNPLRQFGGARVELGGLVKVDEIK